MRLEADENPVGLGRHWDACIEVPNPNKRWCPGKRRTRIHPTVRMDVYFSGAHARNLAFCPNLGTGGRVRPIYLSKSRKLMYGHWIDKTPSTEVNQYQPGEIVL